MGALTPQWLMDFETRSEYIRNNEYSRLSDSENLWARMIYTQRTSTGKKDVLPLLFQSAQIKALGGAGDMRFEEIGLHYTEIETEYAGDGFKLTRDQMEDVLNGQVGGEALDLAEEWNIQFANQMVYWPQKQVAEFLKNAHSASYATGYDGKAFFATDHPVHPLDVARGTYSNLLTGSGTYAIDASVEDTDAIDNLTKVFAHIRNFKMPNGNDPRFLKPVGILCGSTLAPRVNQLVDAKFIAKVAGSGAGSADVSGYLGRLGFTQAVEAPELNGFESDTTYFVIVKPESTSRFGAVIYTERRPFEVMNYGPMTEAELGRRQEFEWHGRGKNSVSPGHPYLLIKVKATT